MTNTIARIKKQGKNYEILVDLDAAMAFKSGKASSVSAETEKIFHNIKSGDVASNSDLQSAFGTNDINEVVQKIVKSGEIEETQEHRDEEKDKKFKQLVEFLVTNSIDPQSGNPHTPERIRSAIAEAHINLKNVSLEQQIPEVLEKLSKIIPIKIETKKVKVTVPAIHTGKAYGVVAQYKDSEKWLDNGDLEIIVAIPAGIVMDFYDKLNSVTHGSALTEEIGEEGE